MISLNINLLDFFSTNFNKKAYLFDALLGLNFFIFMIFCYFQRQNGKKIKN